MTGALLLAALLAAKPASAGDWRAALAPVAAERDRLSAELDQALKLLRPRVAAEAPGLLPKLDGAAVKPLPAGYGILPRLQPDNPDRADPAPDPGERHYSIAELAGAMNGEKGVLDAFLARLEKAKEPVAPLVDAFIERRDRLNLLDGHVKYHQAWQPEAERTPGFFARNNELLAAYRVWRSTADAAAKQAAQRKLEDGLVQFSPTGGLRIEGAPGSQVLRVPMQTDIEDDAYLEALELGVENHWNRSAAMKAAGLRIEIHWRKRAPKELYPEGPPVQGAAIDIGKHLDRFGPGALIFTTGASATKAHPNRAIILGPEPIGPHALAHEFSHILGFTDGYLRAYDGKVGDPNGVIFWEVTPFPGDLLADPGHGRVTEAMVRKLLQGYGAKDAAVR